MTSITRLIWEPPFDPELAEKALAMIQAGTALTELDDIAGMPPYATVNYWRRSNPDFDAAVVAASEAKAERLADEILQIADDQSRPPACREVSIKARMAMMKVYNRKKYDPATRVEVGVTARVGDGVSDAELEAEVARQRRRVIEGEARRLAPGSPPQSDPGGLSGEAPSPTAPPQIPIHTLQYGAPPDAGD